MDLFLHEMSKSFEDVTLGANNTVITPIETSPELTTLSLTRSMFQATLLVSFILFALFWVDLLPGHIDGYLRPMFVPEHYGPRNSQHPFDPYSIVHFDYGLLSYFVFGRFDEKKSDDEFLFDNFGNVNWSKGLLSEENLGLFIALSIAVAFESIENSEAVIDLFRKNSGTSKEYIGDSSINVFGDMVACSVGYNFAKFFSLRGFPQLPLLLYFLNELNLALTIRDNLLLIIIQLFFPVEKIKRWQSEVIPDTYKD